jgi:hypothetical protein
MQTTRQLLRTLAFACTLVAAPVVAEEEPTRDTPIARAPELTLGSLLPSELLETVFVSITAEANGVEGPFETSFEALLDDGMILSGIVTNSERQLRMIAPAFEPGPMREALFDDEDFEKVGERTCIGSTEQAMIVCRIGSGILQLTGSSIMDETFPYETLKGYFATVDLAAVATVLAP